MRLRSAPYNRSVQAVLVTSLLVLALSFILPRLAQICRLQTKMSSPYAKELLVAQLAVQRATLLTKRVFHEKVKGTESKADKSPVTIGDYGAQALIISAIHANFPEDEIVAEEESETLRREAEKHLRDQVWGFVNATSLDDKESEALIGGPIKSQEDMLNAIDGGKSLGGTKGRIWALDPIDGTKGFLRGGQYAVCLGFMVDGDLKVGAIGCPNLPVDDSVELDTSIGTNARDDEGRGVLFSAVKGQGATSGQLGKGKLAPRHKIEMKPITDIKEASFCESFEAAHSAHGDQAEIAKRLGITKPSVRMDSQAKYCSIARGAGDVYLRLPVSQTYQEKIWDHAAGDLIVREAGGIVTDANGERLDFTKGRTLAANKGVVAAPKAVHAHVIEVVKDVLAAKAQ